MARLVAATCPKCGAGVRIDPDQEFVTCSYCGVSSFIQTRRRQPTQVVQAQHPVIHLENTARHISGCVMSLIGIGVLGALGSAAVAIFASHAPEIATRFLGIDAGSPIPITVPKIPSPLDPLAVEENLFANPEILKNRLEARLGKPVMLKEMVLYPSYARVVVQDPKVKQHIDSYFYRGGQFQEPEPVRISGAAKSFEKSLFSLDELDFPKIPGLLHGAVREIAVEAGAVTHVIIERGGFGTKAPCIRVYVSGPRDSGYVEYDLRGKRTRVVN